MHQAQMESVPRILIAAMGSGSGKTIMTAALLRALSNRALRSVAFKCGPDYIDPQYLSVAARAPAHNLDAFLCGENNMKYLLAQNSQASDFAMIEGVMGLYDGLGYTDNCSSNHIALLTQTPTLLCVSPSGASLSLAAQISGFLKFRTNTIKGIILNRCSEKMLNFYKHMLEAELGIPVYGALGKVELDISSRHIERNIAALEQKLDYAAASLEKTMDIDAIIALGRTAGDFAYDRPILPAPRRVRIGIAYDEAFSFYYADNLELLRRLGADIVFFSPLQDSQLPEDLAGLVFGGGYPAPLMDKLQANKSMLTSIKKMISNGTPVIAESTGYDYLCKPFAGILDINTACVERPPRFGYISLTAQRDSMLISKGERLFAHEYHYSDSDDNGNAFLAEKTDGRSWTCIHAYDNIFAGYPQLHLWGNISVAERFIKACEAFSK